MCWMIVLIVNADPHYQEYWIAAFNGFLKRHMVHIQLTDSMGRAERQNIGAGEEARLNRSDERWQRDKEHEWTSPFLFISD